MNYDKKVINSWNVVTVQGDMAFPQIETVDKLSDEIKQLVKQGEYKFIFDFKDVPYIDSTGLSIVILTLSNAMRHDEPVKVCGLNQMTKNTFEVMVDFGVKYYNNISIALDEINK